MRKKLSSTCSRALNRFCLSSSVTPLNSSCLCFTNNYKSFCSSTSSKEDKKQLIENHEFNSSSLKLKDVLDEPPTLAFQLKPKIVVMRVSMHCNGCARQVKKHISKLEGVTSYQIDMELNMVVVTGDIVPFEVLQSVSKVKTAQFWDDNCDFI